MPKTISPELKAHLAQPYRTTALICRLKRTDGAIYGFTDTSDDVPYDDGDGLVIYAADRGQTETTMSSSSDLSVASLSIGGFYNVEGIQRNDLIKGLWDYADVKFYLVNYEDLSQGDLKLPSWGRLGRVTINDNSFEAELLGLEQFLSIPVGETTSISCRAEFGDSRCKFDVNDYLETATVQDADTDGAPANPTQSLFYCDVTALQGQLNNVDDWYTKGYLTWTSGENNGLTREIRNHVMDSGFWEITILAPMESLIQRTDTADIIVGCNKTIPHCTGKFDTSNIVNFRGEPYSPGNDVLREIGVV